MLRPLLGTLALAAGLTGVLGGLAAAADSPAFSLGFPWKAVDSDASVTPSTTRKQSQWHIPDDVSTFTLVDDSTQSYADSLTLIQTNFSSNHVKPSVDKDFTCDGKAGHMVEFSTGPTGHQVIINRLLLPETPTAGVLTFTYVRSSSDKDWDPAVVKSMKAFCGTAPV